MLYPTKVYQPDPFTYMGTIMDSLLYSSININTNEYAYMPLVYEVHTQGASRHIHTKCKVSISNPVAKRGVHR